MLWNNSNIQITQSPGTGSWNWELDQPVTQQLELSFREVYPPLDGSDIIITKEGGLSYEGVASETLTLTFDQAGIFYFSATNNFNSERILNVVSVTEPEPVLAAIEVYVGSISG